MDASHVLVVGGLIAATFVAFGLALFTGRVWLAIVGAVLGVPVCLLASPIVGLSLVPVAAAVAALNLASAWVLRHGRRVGAALLIGPFVALSVAAAAAALRPAEVDTETTANASLGDLDGDGDLDVVLAKGRHWPLVDVVLLNDGKGLFTARDLSAVADRSYSAALADLDGDGRLDIVVGNDRPDEKVVYFGEGDAGFRRAGAFGRAHWPTRNVTVADLNGDGRGDLAVANRGGPTYVCLNDGHGAFPSCAELSRDSVTTIAAADMTGDGAIDLVVPHRDRGQSYVYVNDGKGVFGSEKIPFGPSTLATRAVSAGDLDGDGTPDIVVGDETAGGASVYFNLGGRRFADAVALPIGNDTPYAIAVGDLNLDGRTDVVVGNAGTPAKVLLNTGTGHEFTSLELGNGEAAVYGLAIGDVDGDGTPDVVAARSGAPSVVWLNSVRSQLSPESHGPLRWRALIGGPR